MRSVMLAMLLVLATSCAASTNDSPTVADLLRERALAALEKDLSPEEHVELLAGIIIEYEYELDIRDAKIANLGQQLDKPWYMEITDSVFAKVALFLLGVWTGQEMVKVVR